VDREVLVLVILASLAFADGVPVRLQVLAPDGHAIPTATIVFDVEQDFHHVNTFDGTVVVDTLWTVDADEIVLAPGTWLKLTVNAPGYWSSGLHFQVAEARNVHVVTLFPMRVDPAEPAIDGRRAKTLALWDAWGTALTSVDDDRDIEGARRRFGFAARDWAEAALAIHGDADVAIALCRSSGNRGCPLR
jgi:hypothetical protein